MFFDYLHALQHLIIRISEQNKIPIDPKLEKIFLISNHFFGRAVGFVHGPIAFAYLLKHEQKTHPLDESFFKQVIDTIRHAGVFVGRAPCLNDQSPHSGTTKSVICPIGRLFITLSGVPAYMRLHDIYQLINEDPTGFVARQADIIRAALAQTNRHNY